MKAPGHILALACLLAFVAAPSVAQISRQDDEARKTAYEEFRSRFAESRFAEALPLAQRVVQLTEGADPLDDQLPTAYNNLGVVQLRTGDLDAAEASFKRALELLEGRVGIVSRRLIAPLAGLGAVHTTRGHHALAADVLHRALSISRRANGLFNIDQMELLESLITNYDAVGNQAGVERERRYAVQVVQQEYGADDPRTIPAMVLLAEWYERTYGYALARTQWQHVVAVASREDGGRNAATIVGLIGIARNHRLQFVHDPASLMETPMDMADPRPPSQIQLSVVPPGAEQSNVVGTVKMDREGEAAALKALQTLDETPDPPTKLLALALTELGDWYATADRVSKAIPYYRRAWPLFAEMAAAGQPNPLAAPRPLSYRPPFAAMRNRDRTDVELVASPFEFTMSISESGEADSIMLMPGSGDGRESDNYRATQFRRSLARAAFSPRFENGEPVPTDDYRFTDIWYDVASSAPPVPPAQPDPPAEPEPQEEPPES